MSAIPELESTAVRYAKEAIRLDNQGSRGMAIPLYQRAIECLLKIVQLYPKYELNNIFIQRAMTYQERIKVLQGSHAPEPMEESDMSSTAVINEGGGRASAVTELRKSKYDELVVKEKPNVKWDEVVGLEDAKRAIRESIVYPVHRPDLFPLGWPRGALLFGPPGCGKTLLAAAVASEINAYFYSIDAASIMSKWLGEAEKNVARLFNSARENSKEGVPAIIFVDEIDSLLGSRNSEVGGEIRVRNQFLKEMDGVLDKGKGFYVYVIGATNKPWALDWPFIRRFQKRIMVPLPDKESRLAMLKLYTKPLLTEGVELGELAELSKGCTGSDMRDTCQSAQLKVVRELFESGRGEDKSILPRPINMEDFRNTLRDRKPSVTADMMKAYQTWFDMFKAL